MRFAFEYLRATREEGKALIELVLVAPLLVAIALPSIDGVNFARAGHLLNSVTREAGRAAFSCLYLQATPAQVQTCIADNVNLALPPTIQVPDGVGGFTTEANDGIGAIALNAEITITVWEYRDPALGPPVLVAQYQRGALASRIPAAAIAGLNSYKADKGRLLITETRIPLTPITPYFLPERYLVMVM